MYLEVISDFETIEIFHKNLKPRDEVIFKLKLCGLNEKNFAEYQYLYPDKLS